MRLIRQTDYRIMPWKNGGGTTTEIFASPEGVIDFDWRVSIATVSADGPFSTFPGFERHIMVLEGNGMTLEVENAGTVALASLRPYSFSGDSRVNGRLRSGPVKDFNLMVRRDFGVGTLQIQQIDKPCRLGGSKSQFLIYTLSKHSILLDPDEFHVFPAGETLVICEVSP